MNKKVIASEQTADGVVLRFSDGTTAEGHILVGADGAYSTIRQHLYDDFKKQGRLPASDAEPLPFSAICLVGQTNPLDPAEFPNVALEESQIQSILQKGTPYSVKRSFPSLLLFWHCGMDPLHWWLGLNEIISDTNNLSLFCSLHFLSSDALR